MARKSRTEKYPETRTFHYHNQNPKNRITGDCAFRAISLATGQDYNDCVMSMAMHMCKTGYVLDDSRGIDKYLQSLGWTKMPQPKHPDGTKYTGKEFCKSHKTGRYVIHIGSHHVACVNDGKIWDIWDCSDRAVGNYWCKV